MFEEIKKELQGKSDNAIYLYLKSIDLSDVIQYLKENSTYNDIPEKRKFKLIQDFLKGRSNICPVCGKIIEHGLKNCSLKCRDLNPETQKRKELTKIKNFRTKNFNNREKAKETCLKKYGVEYISQVSEVKNKVAETNLKKYGVKCNLLTDEFKEKAKATNLKRYGTEFAQQSNEIKKKTELTCLEKYNSTSYIGSKTGREKVRETFRTKYGVENVMQVKEFCDKSRETQLKNKIKNYNLYNNKKYIKENLFLDDCTPNSKAIQKFFDISQPTCSEHLRKLFGSEIHYENSISDAEIELQNYVKTICNNVLTNDRTIIRPLELDIVLPDIKLAIEYNGSYWHNVENKGPNYHLNKTHLCQENGYQLFHIFEFDDIDIWKSMISNKLKLNKVIYARNCEVREIEYKDVENFLNENHIQKACTSKINLGLYYNNILLEVMTFSKPRFNKDYDYELLRLCTKKYYSVVGGASKLFMYFTSKYNGSVISYANRRFSNGSIYKILGFKEVKITPPNYFYIKNDIVLTRYQCQKHKLKELFEKEIIKEYNESLTESEIMSLNKFMKIYDSGNIVFGYK